MKLKLLLLQLSFYAEKERGKEGEVKRVGDVVNAVVVTYFRFAELAQEERNERRLDQVLIGMAHTHTYVPLCVCVCVKGKGKLRF